MKKVFFIFPLIVSLAFGGVVFGNFAAYDRLIAPGNTLAATPSGSPKEELPFPQVIPNQPTQPSREGLWSRFKGSMEEFWSSFKQEVWTGGQDASSQNSTPVQPPVQQPSSQQNGPENQTPRKPYILEPNQFKKVCGKNEYVLWWSQRGSDGKDIKDIPKDKSQNGELIVPSCQELAKCHCCCNTCTNDSTSPCPPDVCFSIYSPCDSKPVCNTKCFCSKCKNECETYTAPFHPKAFNIDCGCSKAGCPDAKGCKIVLYQADSGWLVNAYNQGFASIQQIPRVNTKNGAARRDNYSKPQVIKTESPDLSQTGWAKKLVQDKGKCCKCVPEQQANQGPSGGGK